MKLQGAATAIVVVLVLLVIVGFVWIFTALTKDEASTGTEGRGVFGTLFPFGRGETPAPLPGQSQEGDTAGPVPQIRRVTDAAVAGAQFVTRADGMLMLKYVERDTGHWYEVPADAFTSVRLTNTTIPGVHDIETVSSTTMVMRILGENDQIDTFLGQYAATTTDGALTGTLLAAYARIDAHTGALVGVRETLSGSVIEAITPNGKVTPLFASDLVSWVPHVRAGRIFITSAPASGIAGSWYEIRGGEAERIVGELPGLEVLVSDDAQRAVVSTGGTNTLSLLHFDFASRSLRTLPLRTLVEKCVWESTTAVLCAVPRTLPAGRYPTDWHLGRVHTTDDIWRINTDTGATEAVLELEQLIEVEVDGTSLVSNDKGGYVAFINKRDRGLWLAKLTP